MTYSFVSRTKGDVVLKDESAGQCIHDDPVVNVAVRHRARKITGREVDAWQLGAYLAQGKGYRIR